MLAVQETRTLLHPQCRAQPPLIPPLNAARRRPRSHGVPCRGVTSVRCPPPRHPQWGGVRQPPRPTLTLCVTAPAGVCLHPIRAAGFAHPPTPPPAPRLPGRGASGLGGPLGRPGGSRRQLLSSPRARRCGEGGQLPPPCPPRPFAHSGASVNMKGQCSLRISSREVKCLKSFWIAYL